MKANIPLIVLVVISAGLIMIPLHIEYKWLFAIHILVYTILAYFVNKSVSSNSLFEDKNENTHDGRLQLLIWTIVILSVLSTSLAFNLHTSDCSSNALAIEVPASLWILMGISGVTVAGESAMPLRSNNTEGFIFTYENAEDKSRGVNGDFNVERLQFILFIVITVSAYLVVAFHSFDPIEIAKSGNCISKLPEIHDTLAILASVSSGTYLAVRMATNKNQ